jgi:hypothetical protein
LRRFQSPVCVRGQGLHCFERCQANCRGRFRSGSTRRRQIQDQRKPLDLTATSWLSFREFNRLLVYYAHLIDVMSLRDPKGAHRDRQRDTL